MRQRSQEKQNLYAVQNYAANIKYSARQHENYAAKRRTAVKQTKKHKNDAVIKKKGREFLNGNEIGARK
jgi:hypothetical protein